MVTIKKEHWFFLLGGILFLSLIALFIPRWFSPAATYAEIYQDGSLIETISLTDLTKPVVIPIKDGECENVILVEPGKIQMQSANCPDKLCVRQGAIQNRSGSIVCLPHRLVIRLKGGTPPIDAISQ